MSTTLQFLRAAAKIQEIAWIKNQEAEQLQTAKLAESEKETELA